MTRQRMGKDWRISLAASVPVLSSMLMARILNTDRLQLLTSFAVVLAFALAAAALYRRGVSHNVFVALAHRACSRVRLLVTRLQLVRTPTGRLAVARSWPMRGKKQSQIEPPAGA